MRNTLLIVALLFAGFSAKTQTKDISGLWSGTLKEALRIVFHFTKNGDGTYKGTVDSPDQNAKDIPCNKVTFSSDSVIVEIKSVGAAFKAILVNDSTLSGKFTQAGVLLPLTVKHVEKVFEAIVRRQTPQPPFNYTSEDVEYNSTDGTVHFGATLTYPKRDGPFATAILITGSGQQDRDETILNHKPFAVIADYLTRNGYAVLRVDDRGMGKTSFGDVAKATTADFAKDVESSLAYLNTRKEVDKRKIGLIGHSEGGEIASIVGSRNKNIDFIIMLAGPGVKGSTLLADQNEAILSSLGKTKEAASAYRFLYERIIIKAMENDTAAAINESLSAYREWKKNTDSKIVESLQLRNDSAALSMIREMVKLGSIPWFKYFLQTDPADYIKQLRCKVLALNGSKDIQVLPQQNLKAIKNALAKSKSKEFEIKELQGLNHLFQHCKECTVQEYGQLEETFAPEALEAMSKWLIENVSNK